MTASNPGGQEKARQQTRRTSITPRVLSFIQKHSLMVEGKPLLVAVSGGPDSVCLLHLLASLRDQGIKMHVAHLNHRLRPEANDDAAYVADMARGLRLPATIGERDVMSHQKKHRQSLEEAARQVRYQFLAEVAMDIGASRVAVAHTRDDHVETILLHLVRGSGTRGLKGLEPLSKWRDKSSGKEITIARPLLEISRQETLGYCAEYHLEPRFDVSNLSMSPLRNRLRHQLIPLLKSYNPAISDVMVRFGHIAGDDMAYLANETARLWPTVALEEDDTISLDRSVFDRLEVVPQRYLLRMAMEKLLGDLKDIESRHLEEMVIKVLNKPAGRKINLPGGIVFLSDYHHYRFARNLTALAHYPSLEGETAIAIPGVTCFSGWCFSVSVITHEAMIEDTDCFTAYFDYDRTGYELLVRRRQRGDRFQPLGLEAPKKVGEFMIDARIPSYLRDRIPLVTSREGIIWLVGYRIDERVKVTPDTKHILCIKVTKPDSE
ncbi:MAG: tRNA lysidine(34) synthetase TilS [Dehalococcoidales bacterium]|jgi:tRNA(Ile)-lysidine synthase